MDKVCYECKYLEILDAQPRYSEYTPGSNASIECLKGHWYISIWDSLGVDLREGLRKAKTCPDFEPTDQK